MGKTTSEVKVLSGPSRRQARPLNSSPIVIATGPGGPLTNSLDPTRGTRPPCLSVGPRPRMRLTITVRCGTAMWPTVTQADGEVEQKPPHPGCLSWPLPSSLCCSHCAAWRVNMVEKLLELSCPYISEMQQLPVCNQVSASSTIN